MRTKRETLPVRIADRVSFSRHIGYIRNRDDLKKNRFKEEMAR